MKVLDRLIVFAVMALVGILAGGVAAAILIPICYSYRGQFAVGSEWFLIVAIAYAGYTVFNKSLFDSIERS